MSRELQHRTNNAYDTILLVDRLECRPACDANVDGYRYEAYADGSYLGSAETHQDAREYRTYDCEFEVVDTTGDGAVVVGVWETDRNDQAWRDYLDPGNLDDWEPTNPGNTDPGDYGQQVLGTGTQADG